MSDAQPNIVVFFWDNFGWGEIGCYGGGVLRGAPTPRIDSIADQGLKLLKHEVIATCDAEFRAGFDRKITDWAVDFMRRSHQLGKPFYLYLPYTRVHIPPIPDPEYAGKTKRGNRAEILTQIHLALAVTEPRQPAEGGQASA